jgi:hypothetical protein
VEFGFGQGTTIPPFFALTSTISYAKEMTGVMDEPDSMAPDAVFLKILKA